MATVTSSTFNSDFKAYYTYSTSSTNTTYTIKVTNAGLYQSCSWSEYPWKTVLSATDYSSTTATKGTVYWTKGYHALITADKSYSYARKASAYTVTVKAKTSKNVSGGGSGTASKTFTIPALPSYKITYNANGGTLPTSGFTNPQTKVYNTTLKLNTGIPTRVDDIGDGATTQYTFLGWSTSDTATTPTYLAGASYAANATATLYAVWAKTSGYLILYNTGDGSEISPQEKPIGEDITITTEIPVRHGYAFKGWSLSPDGTTLDYHADDTYSMDSSITLYAIWTPWTHAVHFNANGGSGDTPRSFVKTGNIDATIPSIKPTRAGYLFKCWNTNSSGLGTNYYPNDIYAYEQNGGAITLYAIWIQTDILMYANGYCKALDFKEGGSGLAFVNDGTVESIEFIEGRTLSVDGRALYLTEMLEQHGFYRLLDESGLALIDESGNYLYYIE